MSHSRSIVFVCLAMTALASPAHTLFLFFSLLPCTTRAEPLRRNSQSRALQAMTMPDQGQRGCEPMTDLVNCPHTQNDKRNVLSTSFVTSVATTFQTANSCLRSGNSKGTESHFCSQAVRGILQTDSWIECGCRGCVTHDIPQVVLEQDSGATTMTCSS